MIRKATGEVVVGRCPKCGQADPAIEYKRKGTNGWASRCKYWHGEAEHFHSTCVRCTFMWPIDMTGNTIEEPVEK